MNGFQYFATLLGKTINKQSFVYGEDKAACIGPYKNNSVNHYWASEKFSVGTILKVFCGYNIALTLYKSTAIINCM